MEALLPFEKSKHEVLIKRKAETNPGLGCKPEGRDIKYLIEYGIINVNKPKGPTSHMVSEYVQKILEIDKSGHSGTLDPGVSGVLPVALGRATRIVQALLNAGKEYVGIMHLHKKVDEEEIKEIFKKFTGKIKQTPPLKSAVKRVQREREIYYFEILGIDEKDVLFKIGCEAGTYIRTICHDIGKTLGTGAHLAQLVRTKAGPFMCDETVTLQDLEDAYWFYKNENNEKYLRYCIKPIEFGVSHLRKIFVLDSAVDSLCHGADLNLPGVSKIESGTNAGDLIAIMTLKGELIALGVAKKNSQQILGNEKGIAVKTTKVFMKPRTYHD